VQQTVNITIDLTPDGRHVNIVVIQGQGAALAETRTTVPSDNLNMRIQDLVTSVLTNACNNIESSKRKIQNLQKHTK